MPKPSPSITAAGSENAPLQSSQSDKKHRPGKQNSTAESAAQKILAKLGTIDSQMAAMANIGPDPVTLQIAETVNSQSLAISEVAAAIKDLQASLVSAVTDAVAGQRIDRETDEEPEIQDAVADSDSENQPLPAAAWDDIRNAFLASHGEEVAADNDVSANVTPIPERPQQTEEPEAELPTFTIISDPHSLNEDELRTAVIDQERTISTLVRRLQKKSRAAQSMTQEQLEEFASALPEQLQKEVTDTLQALNNQHRYAELELSLERARVSRQASQLEVTRERLDARARAMGIEITEAGTIAAGDGKSQRGSKARNWLGAMGFGN